jgi:hypothetical protein
MSYDHIDKAAPREVLSGLHWHLTARATAIGHLGQCNILQLLSAHRLLRLLKLLRVILDRARLGG